MASNVKAVLAVMGINCCDDVAEAEFATMIDVLEKEYGITFCNLEVATSNIKDVIEQMSENTEDDEVFFEPISKKQSKRKWNIPKMIGKPQKRKGRF